MTQFRDIIGHLRDEIAERQSVDNTESELRLTQLFELTVVEEVAVFDVAVNDIAAMYVSDGTQQRSHVHASFIDRHVVHVILTIYKHKRKQMLQYIKHRGLLTIVLLTWLLLFFSFPSGDCECRGWYDNSQLELRLHSNVAQCSYPRYVCEFQPISLWSKCQRQVCIV